MEQQNSPQTLRHEHIPASVVTVNSNGVIVNINAAAAAYSNMRVSGLRIGASFFELLHDEKAKRFELGIRSFHVMGDNGGLLTWEVFCFPFFADDEVQGYDLFICDRTESVQQLESWKEMKARYDQLLEVYVDPIIIYQDMRIVFINEVAEEVLGGPQDQMLGQSIMRFIHPDYRELVISRIQNVMISKKRTEMVEIQVYNLRNEVLDVEVMSNTITYEGKPAVLTVMRNITERKKAQQEIIHMAYHDALTGLPNRRMLTQQLSLLIERSGTAHAPFAVIAIDIDRFKHINDSLGHTYGDLFLIEMGVRIQACLAGRTATLARMGGDEFTILVEHFQDQNDLTAIAERVTRELRQPFHLKGNDLYVTASLGIATFPRDGQNVMELLRNADFAMYEQKKSGKNGHFFFSCELAAQLQEKFELEGHLRRALELNELTLFYQPQFYAAHEEERSVTGVEALIRWNHPTKGMLLPGVFIPLAEESGVIYEIGTWVLREACRQMKAWQDAGGPLIPVWVNLSSMQFHQPDLEGYIRQVLDHTGLEPHYLGLEITESMMMDASVSTHVLSALNALGVQISLDDFGTGYSSLSYLQRFKVHKLKIDQSFIKNIAESDSDQVIVATIISMAKHLNLGVVAEGIETKDQLNFLLGLECKDIQGYYFSRPLSVPEIEEAFINGSQRTFEANTEYLWRSTD